MIFSIWVIFYMVDSALYAAAIYRLPGLVPPWTPWLKWIPASGFYLYAASFTAHKGKEYTCPTCGDKFRGADDRFCPKCHAKAHAGSPLGDDNG